jgi:hypothetical protein
MTVNRNSKEPITLQSSAPTTDAQSELQEEIHRRAYELYEERGGGEGRELDDWLQAEAEVTQSMAKVKAA